MGLSGSLGRLFNALYGNLTWWQAILLAWLITPGMMFLLGWIFESRTIKILDNSKAFLPGDLLLGVAFGVAVGLSRYLPKTGFWQNWWYLPLVVASVFIVTLFMMLVADGARYPFWARVSPTKIYHDICCYGIYGTLLTTIIIPVLVSKETHPEEIGVWTIIDLCLLLFICGNVSDALCPPKLEDMHVEDWRPFWKKQ